MSGGTKRSGSGISINRAGPFPKASESPALVSHTGGVIPRPKGPAPGQAKRPELKRAVLKKRPKPKLQPETAAAAAVIREGPRVHQLLQLAAQLAVQLAVQVAAAHQPRRRFVRILRT